MSTLGAVFDPKANGLNAVRLTLAATVIVYHTFPLTGRTIGAPAVQQLLEHVPVDGFFAISGFLIVSSWARRPHWWAFLRARALRILPGLWACLVVVAALVAPAALLLTGHGLPSTYAADAARFVVDGLDVRMSSYGIGATPADVPHPGAWNGSLWTLFWELGCYLVVLAAGVLGLLRRRWAIPAAAGSALLAQALVDLGAVDGYWARNGARFALMFAAGALLWFLRDRLPTGRWWAVGAAAALVVSLVMLPEYRLLGALPLAYLVLYVGAVARHPRWRLRNDLSYGVYIYGFPVQQTLVLAGLGTLAAPVFAALAIALTVPLAAASWWWVEKPAMRLKGVRRAATVQEAAVAA